MNLSKHLNRSLCIMHCALCVVSSASAASVSINSVTQRWPWNNKVDIRYTISGADDIDAVGYCKLVFTATIGGHIYTIDGATDVIAAIRGGTHTVTWTNAPAGVKSDDCRMSAAIQRTGGYYMVIDLDTGAYAFDDLAGSDTANAKPNASNARYNIPLWKTDRMVLRRIPKSANGANSSFPNGYPTGDNNDAQYATSNSQHYWETDKDYFIGVFMVTQYQYEKLMGDNPSTSVNKTEVADNPRELRPVNAVSWTAIRTSIPSTTAIPTVNAAGIGTFMQRLMFLTGNDRQFDLPTEVMFEIAARAGYTTKYVWGEYAGNTFPNPRTYSVCYDGQSDGNRRAVYVGSNDKNCNRWGLFDMVGNVADWCRDRVGLDNLADAMNPWTPYWAESGNYRLRNTLGIANWADPNYNGRASYRASAAENNLNYSTGGFRVSIVIE